MLTRIPTRGRWLLSSCLPSRRHPRKHSHPAARRTPAVHEPSPSFALQNLPPPGAATEHPPTSYVVRLSCPLASPLGRAEGVELPEDELLGWLGRRG